VVLHNCQQQGLGRIPHCKKPCRVAHPTRTLTSIAAASGTHTARPWPLTGGRTFWSHTSRHASCYFVAVDCLLPPSRPLLLQITHLTSKQPSSRLIAFITPPNSILPYSAANSYTNNSSTFGAAIPFPPRRTPPSQRLQTAHDPDQLLKSPITALQPG
jgi:hypothetical protein